MGSLSIWHLLIIGILVAVIYGIYRFAKRRPPVQGDATGPVGVGSWLLLLVIGLMFLGPLISAGRINSDFMMAEINYPALKTLPVWATYKTATWWVILVVCCLSFYAGLGLARKRTRAVVTRAQITLWVIGPVASIVLGVIVPAIVLPASNLDSQFLISLIASVIVAAIWSAYLSRSRRVTATYGEREGVGLIAYVLYFLLPKRGR